MTRRYLVSGRVQGVGYRWFAQREAERLSLTGYAANLADGRVEVVAEGEPRALEALEQALARGPRSAQVTGVVTEPVQVPESFTTFSIR
jgi:acylphosphatase